jgi:hypothetical protein
MSEHELIGVAAVLVATLLILAVLAAAWPMKNGEEK